MFWLLSSLTTLVAGPMFCAAEKDNGTGSRWERMRLVYSRGLCHTPELSKSALFAGLSSRALTIDNQRSVEVRLGRLCDGD